ncbi:MAG: response regulator [Bacteroidales bacterium]|nr:response regulator [Bacteroidales bacterium]
MEDPVYHYVVIDDNESIQSFIIQVLNEFDWLCVEQSFGNLSDAVCYLKCHEVDIVFLDLCLPDMDGLDIFDQLEKMPYTIIITAFADQFSRGVCRKIGKGISAFLEKPFTSEALLNAIENFKRSRLKGE